MPSIARMPGAASRNGAVGAKNRIAEASSIIDPASITGQQQNQYPPPTNVTTATVAPIARIDVRHHSENHTPRQLANQATAATAATMNGAARANGGCRTAASAY